MHANTHTITQFLENNLENQAVWVPGYSVYKLGIKTFCYVIISTMQHFPIPDVLRTSQTKFSGFNEDSSTATAAEKGAPPTAAAAKLPANSAGTGQGKKHQSTQHKKKPQQRNKESTISLRDALDQVREALLNTWLCFSLYSVCVCVCCMQLRSIEKLYNRIMLQELLSRVLVWRNVQVVITAIQLITHNASLLLYTLKFSWYIVHGFHN